MPSYMSIYKTSPPKKRRYQRSSSSRSDKMLHCSSLSISACILFLLIPPTYSYFVAAPLADLINSTCKSCAGKSTILNYSFCVTTLQAIPASHVTNLQGLALIAMELALGNATSTVSTIEKMLNSKEYDPFAIKCLQDCLELYADAAEMLVDSIGAFLWRQFDAAYILMSAVMDATATCEEGFTEKMGEMTPLTKENYDLFEIGDIVLCIINLFSSELPSLYS